MEEIEYSGDFNLLDFRVPGVVAWTPSPQSSDDSLSGSMVQFTPHTRRAIEDVFIDIEDCSASTSEKKMNFNVGPGKTTSVNQALVGGGTINLANPATPSTTRNDFNFCFCSNII